MLFIVVAMVLGVVMKTCKNMKEWVKAIVAIVLIVAMFAVGMKLPWYLNGNQWNLHAIMAYSVPCIRTSYVVTYAPFCK